MEYPPREKFFAQRFHRIMAKLCLAQDVGALGYAILSVVVSQEDACRYRKAVTYYDSQLMPLLGCKSDSQLVKTRKKLVSAGWLHYVPGRKGVPSSYWVVIPEQFKDVEDTGIGEHVDGIRSFREANEERKRNTSGTNEERIENERGTNEERIENERGTNEEHSLPYTLNPIPSTLSPQKVLEETVSEQDFNPRPAQPARHVDFNPIAEFSPKVQEATRRFWLLYCGQYHGKAPLRNLHSEQTHKELMHFAKAIDIFGDEAIAKLKAYYAKPPKEDRQIHAYGILSKLGLVKPSLKPFGATSEPSPIDISKRIAEIWKAK